MDGPARAFKSAAATQKAAVDVSEEVGVPGFCMPGEEVYAMGLFAGSRMKFRAKVLRLRQQWPRIVIEYTATADGEGTHRHELPEMITAYVWGRDVWAKDW